MIQPSSKYFKIKIYNNNPSFLNNLILISLAIYNKIINKWVYLAKSHQIYLLHKVDNLILFNLIKTQQLEAKVIHSVKVNLENNMALSKVQWNCNRNISKVLVVLCKIIIQMYHFCNQHSSNSNNKDNQEEEVVVQDSEIRSMLLIS